MVKTLLLKAIKSFESSQKRLGREVVRLLDRKVLKKTEKIINDKFSKTFQKYDCDNLFFYSIHPKA
jgi:hypothetical protein